MKSMIMGGAVMAMLASAGPALAVFDPAGDFLPTHEGPALADADIRRATAAYFENSLVLFAEMDGDLVSPGLSYVWGVDRGAGTAGLFDGEPPVGPGVTFDAVVVLRADATGEVVAFNEAGPPTVTSIEGAVLPFGAFIFAFLDEELLPSRGFAFEGYRFNFWTRTGAGNRGIADLAQAEGTFAAVPEPSSWAMLIAGFGAMGGAMRRRRFGTAVPQ